MFCLWISCCSVEGVHWSSPSIRLVYTIFTLNVATDSRLLCAYVHLEDMSSCCTEPFVQRGVLPCIAGVPKYGGILVVQ